MDEGFGTTSSMLSSHVQIGKLAHGLPGLLLVPGVVNIKVDTSVSNMQWMRID
jgi:hypothetical protein